jgi:hypothetical protein
MPQRKKFNEYYSAGEVKKLLDITDGMLYNYVRYGHLERVIPPGKKQGVYRRSEVEKLALELNAFLAGSSEGKKVVFSKVTPDDVPEHVRVTQEIFGKNTGLTVENRTAWINRNPDVSYQIRHDGEIIGCATLLPLPLERIEAILKDEVNSEETPASEVGVYEPGQKYHIYAMGIGVTPLVSKHQKRLYGAKLIRGLEDAITELGRRGIEIETVTARSVTTDGVRLMRHLGFQRIPSITRNHNFRMIINECDVPFIHPYKEALQEAQKQTGQQKVKVK